MIRVLVVDDAPLIRASLTQSVEEENETTVVAGNAANGEKALAWLEAHYADLCITDIRMPMMDGLALIEHINAKYPWMKCMVVSSYDDFEYAKQSIQLKALDYILKPVNPTLLSRALDRAVRQIHQDRSLAASDMLLRRLPHHRQWVERWLEQIRTLRTDTLPLLIVETLELLESWVDNRYYLLNALSNIWLRTMIEEMMGDKLHLELDEGKDLGLGEKKLENSSVRGYFRLCAVRRLEEGAYRLVEAMKGVRDHQTSRKIEQIQEYIRVHLTENIVLKDMAAAVDMNKSYMCTFFKQETGMTIWSHIIAERMQKARNLLLGSNAKVYEIAYEVGYEDVAHFSSAFKKTYGMSPQDYKKRMKS